VCCVVSDWQPSRLSTSDTQTQQARQRRLLSRSHTLSPGKSSLVSDNVTKSSENAEILRHASRWHDTEGWIRRVSNATSGSYCSHRQVRCPQIVGTICSYIPSTCTPNMKSLCLFTTKIWRATKNAKIWVVWGIRGHTKSSETSPW